MNTFLLATAGHVDHGKSTLIHVLTGTHPDRLPEEKARGITIDLGFAHLDLPHPEDPAQSLHIGIIDVPGHEDYITNMAAGTAAADLALLIIAANEGWMPQTQEHLDILQYQGIPQLLVVITKSDLPPTPTLHDQIRTHLASTPYAGAPTVSISAATGQGLDDLRLEIARTLATLPPRLDTQKPRLHIDRVFKRPGLGPIVTGSLVGGGLSPGNPYLLEPGGTPVRIRTLQSHHTTLSHAQPGMRIAANIPDLADSTRRGYTLLDPSTGGASTTFDTLLHRLPSQAPSPPPLRSGIQVWLQLGTADLPARLLLADAPSLSPGQSALAQLRLESPYPAFLGDRFILRDWSRRHTLAGGQILDLDPPRLPAATRLERLRALASSLDDLPTYLAASLPINAPAPLHSLLARSPWTHQQILTALHSAAQTGAIITTPRTACRTSYFRSLATLTHTALEARHEQNPTDPTLPLADLRSSLAAHRATPDLIDHLLQTDPALDIHNNRVQLRAHRPQLPALLAPAERRIREALSLHPFDPPSRDQLAPDLRSRLALQYLLATGYAVQIAPAVILSRKALDDAIFRIREYLGCREQATVTQLKQLLGSTRRIMVPLLEYLDAHKITARSGDFRFLPTSKPRLQEPSHV